MLGWDLNNRVPIEMNAEKTRRATKKATRKSKKNFVVEGNERQVLDFHGDI